MDNKTDKDCCKGCLKGTFGENPACKARLMFQSASKSSVPHKKTTYEN
jgi:hypothetical protein